MNHRGDDPTIIEKRLKNDVHIFDVKMFNRIDLHLYNEEHTLKELTETVHQAYQTYLLEHKS